MSMFVFICIAFLLVLLFFILGVVLLLHILIMTVDQPSIELYCLLKLKHHVGYGAAIQFMHLFDEHMQLFLDVGVCEFVA